MKNITKTLFISDLHLSANHPVELKLFLNLLNNCEKNVDAIYILGDLFDVWIGDDEKNNVNNQVISALKSLAAKKIPIYFLHGNRDFLIGKKFFNASGITFLSDESEVFIYNTRVLLMHGDTLCINDTAYLKSRKWLRNRFLQAFFLLLPLSFRQKLAQKMREKSMQHTSSASFFTMDADQKEIESIMKKHHLFYLIHGHTHRPGIHHFEIDGEQACRIVLGAWHGKASVLEWYSSQEKKLIEM